MQRFIRIGCLLVLFSASANALMAPEYYRKARAGAPYHVQVAITKVVAPRQGPGNCEVEGKVAEVFKDATGQLPKGADVDFTVACRRPGDTVPLGGTIWLDTNSLEQAEFIEVYLNDTGAGFEVALWNTKIIAAPSAAPQFPVD
jgi:hypothetical protein